ncbi:hypothetical protein J1614_007203 [Plenodomus biglobosus]|nr:hypothetical protein J1614_007203 [Plenodomus biglobosus]
MLAKGRALRPKPTHKQHDRTEGELIYTSQRPAKALKCCSNRTAQRRESGESHRTTSPLRSSSYQDTEATSSRPQVRQSEVDELQEYEIEHGERIQPVQLPLTHDELQAAHNVIKHTPHDYLQIFNDLGYNAIIDAAYDEAEAAGHYLARTPGDHEATPRHEYASNEIWRDSCVEMLASCPRNLLESILDGSLPRKIAAETDTELTRLYDKHCDITQQSLWAQRDSTLESFAPSIYMRAFVNDRGLPPPREHILKIIEFMRQYISGDEEFEQQNAAIDSQSPGQHNRAEIRAGYRRYLGSRVHAARIEAFCAAAEANIRDYESDSDSSLSIANNPLKYFGFTRSPNARAIRQASPSATNVLSALVMAIGRYAFRKLAGGPVYGMKSFTVCHLACPEECRIGEELFCRIGGGYYYTGRGFNVAPAGDAALGDIGDMSYRAATEMWFDCLLFRSRLPFYLSQMDHEALVSVPKYISYTANQSFDDNSDDRSSAAAVDSRIEELHSRIKELEVEHEAIDQRTISIATLQQLLGAVQDGHRETEVMAREYPSLLMQSAHSSTQAEIANAIRNHVRDESDGNALSHPSSEL